MSAEQQESVCQERANQASHERPRPLRTLCASPPELKDEDILSECAEKMKAEWGIAGGIEAGGLQTSPEGSLQQARDLFSSSGRAEQRFNAS